MKAPGIKTILFSAILLTGGFFIGHAVGLPPIRASWIYFCVYLLGYAVCSGSNVAYFAFSHRQLRRKVARGRQAPEDSVEARESMRARTILKHLEDPNWTLAAILLTNVGFGVQLSQLSDRLFIGMLAVIMPIVCITIVGEFFAQATFLRYAGSFCYYFSPFVWLLKWITCPISWPLARIVDSIYGREALRRLNEKDLLADLELELTEFAHLDRDPNQEVLDRRELQILINVARADDEYARIVGEVLDPRTVVSLEIRDGLPIFPDDPLQFVEDQLRNAPHPWFVITDKAREQPVLLLDADGFIRSLLHHLHFKDSDFNPRDHIYRVRIYNDADVKLGQIVSDLQVEQEHPEDDVIDVDVAIIWTAQQQWIITGGDILGRLLRGVPRERHWRYLREDRRGESAKTALTQSSSEGSTTF